MPRSLKEPVGLRPSYFKYNFNPAFGAMISGRPYREPLNIPEAVEELKQNSGTQFDPKVIKVFCRLYMQKKFRSYLTAMKRRSQDSRRSKSANK